MKDSLELAELVEKSQDPSSDLTLNQAALVYEQGMFPRAENLQVKTANNKQTMLGPSTPIGLMTGLLKAKARESPSTPGKMLGSAPLIAAVYTYFWIRQQVG